MKLLHKIQQLQRIHTLIRRKATGSPNTLARRLEISPATLYRYLNDMKCLGAPICYCRAQLTYYYQEEYEFSFS